MGRARNNRGRPASARRCYAVKADRSRAAMRPPAPASRRRRIAPGRIRRGRAWRSPPHPFRICARLFLASASTQRANTVNPRQGRVSRPAGSRERTTTSGHFRPSRKPNERSSVWPEYLRKLPVAGMAGSASHQPFRQFESTPKESGLSVCFLNSEWSKEFKPSADGYYWELALLPLLTWSLLNRHLRT